MEDKALMNCSSLSKINLPNTLTEIGAHALAGCSNLKEIKLPNTLTYIGAYAFAGCSNIKEIKLPDKVRGIEVCLFQGCKKLESVTLGPEIFTISWDAFNDTGQPINIYCYTLRPPRYDLEQPMNYDINKITFHVPKSAVDEYKKSYSSLNINIVGDL